MFLFPFLYKSNGKKCLWVRIKKIFKNMWNITSTQLVDNTSPPPPSLYNISEKLCKGGPEVYTLKRELQRMPKYSHT